MNTLPTDVCDLCGKTYAEHVIGNINETRFCFPTKMTHQVFTPRVEPIPAAIAEVFKNIPKGKFDKHYEGEPIPAGEPETARETETPLSALRNKLGPFFTLAQVVQQEEEGLPHYIQTEASRCDLNEVKRLLSALEAPVHESQGALWTELQQSMRQIRKIRKLVCTET